MSGKYRNKSVFFIVLISFGLWVYADKPQWVEGSLSEVVATLNRDLSMPAYFMDPMLDVKRSAMSVVVEADKSGSYAASLSRAIKPGGLDILPLRSLRGYFITSAGSRELDKALDACRKRDFEKGLDLLRRSLKDDPEFAPAIALRRMTDPIVSFHDTLNTKRKEIITQMNTGRSYMDVGRSFADYDQTFGELMEAFWSAAYDGQAINLAYTLKSHYRYIENQVDKYKSLLKEVSEYGTLREKDTFLNRVEEFDRSLEEGLDILQGEEDKTEALIRNGGIAMKAGDLQQAVEIFSQAFDQCPINMSARVRLGQALAYRKSVMRKESVKQLKELNDQKDEVTPERIEALVEQTISDRDQQAASLLLTMAGIEAAGLKLDDRQQRLLKALIDAPDGSTTGVVDGLATSGGHFSGGVMYPVSVTFAKRTTAGEGLDIKVNELSGSLDQYMLTSMDQSLQWLNKATGGILGSYEIVIHFKDLEHGKGGDSLGAALCTASFSGPYNLPVAKGITMTGSVRGYGGVGPVGGIPAKLNAAVKDKKKTILLPADNKNVLLLIDDRTASEIRIVLAEKVETYLLYALGHAQADDTLMNWKEASMLYDLALICNNLGMCNEAAGIFERVHQLAPNDYSTTIALSHIADAGISSTYPTWIQDVVKGMIISPAQTAPEEVVESNPGQIQKPFDYQQVADLLAHYVEPLAASEENKDLVDDIVSIGLALAPGNRELLLMKAKIIRGVQVELSEDSAVQDTIKIQMLDCVKQLQASPSKLDKSLARYLSAFVLEYVEPTNEQCLLIFGKEIEQGIFFDSMAARTKAALEEIGELKAAQNNEVVAKAEIQEQKHESEFTKGLTPALEATRMVDIGSSDSPCASNAPSILGRPVYSVGLFSPGHPFADMTAKPVMDRKKIESGSLSFQRTYACLKDAAAKINANSMTCSLWIKPAKEHSGQIISNGSYFYISLSRNTLQVNVRSNLAGTSTYYRSQTINSKQKLSSQVWQHVVVTYHEGNLNLYINGKLQDSTTTDKSCSISFSQSDLFLGRHGQANHQHFYGEMDDLVIYNHALNENQVQALYVFQL